MRFLIWIFPVGWCLARERGCCWTLEKQSNMYESIKKRKESESMEYGGKIRRVYLAKTFSVSNSVFMNHKWVMRVTGWIIGYVKLHSSQFTGCEDKNRQGGKLQGYCKENPLGFQGGGKDSEGGISETREYRKEKGGLSKRGKEGERSVMTWIRS